MELLDLSHLQFLTLKILEESGGSLDAISLQARFLAAGAGGRSGPAFYQFMSRLADIGYVSLKKKPNRSHRNESHYRLLKKGRKALDRARQFYCGGQS